jgi:hypothetical protein
VSAAVVTLALVGCSDFAAAEQESSEDTEADVSTGGTNPSGDSGNSGNSGTSAGTASASGTTGGSTDPTNASNTDPTNASNTDPTNASNTDPSDPTNPTTGPSTESESETRTSNGESSTGGDDETTADPTTGVQTCEPLDEEPNDAGGKAETQYLGELACGPDSFDVDGTIQDGSDLDWFAFFGNWICGAPNPRVVVDVADNNVEVCVTPLCFENVTAFYTCVEGDNWSEGGDLGCCSTDVVRMDVNCNGTGDESLFASFRVRNSDAVCEDYTLSYAFEVEP